ncbi:MAG: GNAT family N-acetyltransferase [Oscillospiraceae bacterium]|nr:GNAT family N-acetyltransferase [Oscillospiraceae bacterium]
MSDFLMRPLREEDREKAIEIFHASFGDGEAFVRELFSLPEFLKNGWGCETDGELCSCMFAFHGLATGGKKISYLYALCTHPRFRGRGMGAALTAYCTKKAQESGAEGVFLSAAGEGLLKWYSSTMDALPFAPFATEEYSPAPTKEKPLAISPWEYMLLRRGEWYLPSALILAQDCIHRHFGGAFLRLGEDCLCAEKTSEGILIREVCSENEETILSAAAAYFGAEKLFVLRKNPEGFPLLSLGSGAMLLSSVSAPMPFTLS